MLHDEVAPVKQTPICGLCRRPLEADVDWKQGGRVKIRLTCPKHGTLEKGQRYLLGYELVHGDENATLGGS